MRDTSRRVYLLIIFLLTFPTLSLAAQFKVTRVYDGDTIKAKGHDIEIKVRLVGIDAPETSRKKREPGQPYSQRSKKYLTGLVLNKTVVIQGHGLDRYNRLLGVIYLDGKNINLEMIKAGLAEVYRGKPPRDLDLELYWEAETEAKKSKKGIWSLGDKYISPREWRLRKENERGLSKDTLILASVGVFGALVALFIPFLLRIIDWRRRPKLKLCFDENNEEPFFKNLPFNPFYPIVSVDGTDLEIYKPMHNVRLKIRNYGRSTAKNVQVRVEKLEQHGEKVYTFHYHPTKIKWSGETYWNPIDIVADSHFFLDLFHVINAKKDFVYDYHYELYNKQLSKEKIKTLVDRVHRDNEIYWNLWVKDPRHRGIFERYTFEGDIRIYFVLNAENTKPKRFEAEINWTRKEWDKPKVRIKYKSKYVSDDCEKEEL